MLDNGDLLFFDNGKLSELFLTDPFPTSRIRRVRVVDDSYCETIWQYDLAEELYGHSWGSVQLLDNGNYFIYTHGSGHENGSICTLLEISSDQNLVWKASHTIPYAVWYRGYKIPSIHPSAFSVTFDRYRILETDSVDIQGIIIDDNNPSLIFNIFNHSKYSQPYIYNLTDSGNWFANSTDTVFIEDGEIYTVFLEPENSNNIENSVISLSVKPMHHEWSVQEYFYNIYYVNGILNSKNNKVLPNDFILYQNYPNPFNASTTIGYNLPIESNVNIIIYNIRGKVVKNIFCGWKNSGKNSIQWNGSNNDGNIVSTGLYLYRIEFDNYRLTKKMIFMK